MRLHPAPNTMSLRDNVEAILPEWERWYPADFVTESFPGQFRNWFYALLTMSTVMVAWTSSARNGMTARSPGGATTGAIPSPGPSTPW